MVRLRPRLLTCFYCGKRSDTRFDGRTDQFTCKYCDATNHLDENGDITDPPVASTDYEPSIPLSFSSQPTSTSSQSIFCETCLKNQRLFMSSLAQYLPGHEDDDVKLDKDYYRFRRGLEKRYPQICEACEVKAAELIQKAEYTAKTDHLRKMMERSRNNARGTHRKASTPLDWVNLLASLVWWAALVVQCLWHFKALSSLLSTGDSGLSDPDEGPGYWSTAVAKTKEAALMLPLDDALIQASFTASFASAWWNPKFVQVSRGFTKQLSGFRQWYFLQVVLCGSRYALSRLDLSSHPKNAQMSAHVAIASIAFLIHVMGIGCIKTDMTPLFAPHQATISPKADKSTEKNEPIRRKRDEIRTLAETLDDALPQPGDSLPATKYSHTRDEFGYQFIPPTPERRAAPVRDEPMDDEMEWTPTAPQAPLPRALKDQSPSTQPRAFGHAPTSDNSGPFYYKTPAAPTNPARKLRNPPNQPAIWGSAERERRGVPESPNNSLKHRAEASAGTDPFRARSNVEFSKGNFFAPRNEDPEDESLANMLGKGFTLDDEQANKKGWFSWG